jgi:hypothetical protein
VAGNEGTGGMSEDLDILDQAIIDQMAVAFVGHVTVLIATNLVAEVEPSLLTLLPGRVPEADELLRDCVLLDQAIRAPRGQPRLERALHWIDTVWFSMADRTALQAAIEAELSRQREYPLIGDLPDALSEAADLLETLARQTACFRDVTTLWEVVEGVRRWQVDPSRKALIELDRLCQEVKDAPELPSTEIVQRIRFFAREGSLTADQYLRLHFKQSELLAWEPVELLDVVRLRYPLLRLNDVLRLVGLTGDMLETAVAAE